MPDRAGRIRLAVAGLGNCASALVEGIAYYGQDGERRDGLLFAELAGYSVRDIGVVAAFDISGVKVGLPLREAIYQPPNNFVRIGGVNVTCPAPVFRGPTLDGNPEHLARFVKESPLPPVDVAAALKACGAEILLNMLPTGSNDATEFYAKAASEAGCAFINCIPTPLAQRADFQELYAKRGLPLFGDDIKSQMGTTILHRAILALLEMRGGLLTRNSQINVGGNTDFANFVYRSETKLASKAKSLKRYLKGGQFHVGHHYDPTNGPLKSAFIRVEASVFGASGVKMEIKLESDDKPNCAGSVVDLVRIAKGCLDSKVGGFIGEACAFYMKSPPVDMADMAAFDEVRGKWANGKAGEQADVVEVAAKVG